MKINEVISILEELSPLSYSEGFDNTGLLVGNYNTEVKGILVTLDTLESIVDEAFLLEKNFQPSNDRTFNDDDIMLVLFMQDITKVLT